MNPYQRIPGVQPGHIDTAAKFAEMVRGLDLGGLSVVDVGCNLGEMTRLLAAAGARTKGVDVEPGFVRDARKLTPAGSGIRFEVQDGYRLTGRFDLAIVSACFHYFQDPARFLGQLARVASRVRVDVWVMEGDAPTMRLTERGLLVPTATLFEALAAKSFRRVECLGEVSSPDGSRRLLYDLQEPTPKAPASIIIHGDGGAGKTTMGRALAAGGFEHLQLDAVFVEFRIVSRPSDWSVMGFMAVLRGLAWGDFLEHAQKYVRRWLRARRGLDVVLEGWEANDPDYRAVLLEELAGAGWTTTTVLELNGAGEGGAE